MPINKPGLRRWEMIFALIGLIVSLYLTYIKVFPSAPFCFGVGDCEAVNTSVYSAIRGIPIAIFGALAYITLLACLLLESRLPLLNEWGPIAEFGLALAGTLYSAYLTYIEVAVLFKICPYCVTSAVMMTLIFFISVFRFYQAEK
jgi:uncharacterized membrane protein